jgi:hypothetical protein
LESAAAGKHLAWSRSSSAANAIQAFLGWVSAGTQTQSWNAQHQPIMRIVEAAFFLGAIFLGVLAPRGWPYKVDEDPAETKMSPTKNRLIAMNISCLQS